MWRQLTNLHKISAVWKLWWSFPFAHNHLNCARHNSMFGLGKTHQMTPAFLNVYFTPQLTHIALKILALDCVELRILNYWGREVFGISFLWGQPAIPANKHVCTHLQPMLLTVELYFVCILFYFILFCCFILFWFYMHTHFLVAWWIRATVCIFDREWQNFGTQIFKNKYWKEEISFSF